MNAVELALFRAQMLFVRQPRIYFAGAIISGNAEFAFAYKRLVLCLKGYGNVLTEHVADTQLIAERERHLQDRFICSRDLRWVSQSHVLVADVSLPSTGVGVELGNFSRRILARPILCLCRHDCRPSPMVAGNKRIVLRYYQDSDAAILQIERVFKMWGIKPVFSKP
jgi:hypothetical protein